MNVIRCEYCQTERLEPGYIWVTVKLLPVQADGSDIREKHFCRTDCFWKWVRKMQPVTDPVLYDPA